MFPSCTCKKKNIVFMDESKSVKEASHEMWVNGENKLFNPALMWDKIIEEGM
jgi:hypothetical protein